VPWTLLFHFYLFIYLVFCQCYRWKPRLYTLKTNAPYHHPLICFFLLIDSSFFSYILLFSVSHYLWVLFLLSILYIPHVISPRLLTLNTIYMLMTPNSDPWSHLSPASQTCIHSCLLSTSTYVLKEAQTLRAH
jgi:hypothetical protein